MRDRLSDEDVSKIIELFQAGAAKQMLAAEFGISLSSVKRLLRERGMRRDQQS
jgi:DNA invertase Pin-like site-specific DNA recombinase